MAEVTIEEPKAEAAPMEEAVAEEEAAAPEAEKMNEDVNRKLIKTVNLNVETEDYPVLVENVTSRVETLGGYIESREAYNENNIGSRYCNMVLRIPANQLDSFIRTVDEASNITYRQESVEDVTLRYVDLASHQKMLKEEQERLFELLDKAETIEDIITIESRLTEVRYQLESMESQLRAIDNKVDYSTLHLEIYEVERYTPPVKKGAWERITTGFTENVYNVIDGFREFGIDFVIAIPILLVYAVIIVVLFFLGRMILRRLERKNRERQQKRVQDGEALSPYGAMYGNTRRNTRWGGNRQVVSNPEEKKTDIQTDDQPLDSGRN